MQKPDGLKPHSIQRTLIIHGEIKSSQDFHGIGKVQPKK